jgi:xanthine dehydrogenase accessory factor
MIFEYRCIAYYFCFKQPPKVGCCADFILTLAAKVIFVFLLRKMSSWMMGTRKTRIRRIDTDFFMIMCRPGFGKQSKNAVLPLKIRVYPFNPRHPRSHHPEAKAALRRRGRFSLKNIIDTGRQIFFNLPCCCKTYFLNAMKEITKIIATYDQLDFTKVEAALATVIRVEGSSYRREGARMLITNDGQWTGGISGGCLEGDALHKAQQVIFQQKPKVVTYDTTQDDPFQIGVGLGCRGIIGVLIEPIAPENRENPIELLKICAQQETAAALAVVTASPEGEVPVGARLLLFGGQIAAGAGLTDDCRTAMKEGAATALYIGHHIHGEVPLAGGQTIRFFAELIQPPIHLVLLGSNYDLIPLLETGRTLGWKCTVMGNVKKLGKPVFELARVLPKAALTDAAGIAALGNAGRMAAILMAHDYATDFSNLKKILPTAVPYIGMLGPKKRTQRMLEDLAKEGITLSPADEDRLHSPAGLDIGATSPEGIALSIAAEIQALFGGREGGFLKNRKGPIYGANPANHA